MIEDQAPKRPRGRPPRSTPPMSEAERQRRFQLRKQAKAMSTPEVEVICVLKIRKNNT